MTRRRQRGSGLVFPPGLDRSPWPTEADLVPLTIAAIVAARRAPRRSHDLFLRVATTPGAAYELRILDLARFADETLELVRREERPQDLWVRFPDDEHDQPDRCLVAGRRFDLDPPLGEGWRLVGEVDPLMRSSCGLAEDIRHALGRHEGPTDPPPPLPGGWVHTGQVDPDRQHARSEQRLAQALRRLRLWERREAPLPPDPREGLGGSAA